MRRSVLWLAAALLGNAQLARAQEFSNRVRPVLMKHCVACHNASVTSAGLNLAELDNDAQAEARPEIWAKVIEKLETGKMPPPGAPRVAPADLNVVKGWIEPLLDRVKPNPVTVRRLN